MPKKRYIMTRNKQDIILFEMKKRLSTRFPCLISLTYGR